jgi:hypothetical protein
MYPREAAGEEGYWRFRAWRECEREFRREMERRRQGGTEGGTGREAWRSSEWRL